MGGNALKIETIRLNVNQYNEIKIDVGEKLENQGIKYKFPPSYIHKQDHGDLDVLLLSSTLQNKNLRKIIEEVFCSKEIVNNNHITSFEYQNFQIDFIVVKDKYSTTSYHYYSYNDLGNLIGKICYRLNLRYGHYGLKYSNPKIIDGYKFEMEISKNIAKIFEFLGLDINKYNSGLYEVTDIYDLVINSKYYNPKIFEFKNLNNRNKIRNRKRKNYQGFLQYIKDHNPDDYYHFEKHNYYLPIIEEFFEVDISGEIQKWKWKIERKKIVNEKFNGQLIIDKYGITGKELGIAIRKFKKLILDYREHKQNHIFNNKMYLLEEEYDNFILSNTQETIFNFFKLANNNLFDESKRFEIRKQKIEQ